MNATNNQTQANFFDSVLYARAYINEVKIIDVKKRNAKPYCAINASIIDSYVNENGQYQTCYTTIDLIVAGKPAKALLWSLKDHWPTDRFKREGAPWIADINIGSVSHEAFRKKNGDPGAVLKGRLLNIRNLRIGDEDIIGEITEELPKPLLVAPCYINLINVDKGTAKVGILDGEVGKHTCQNVNLTFDDTKAFSQLDAQGLCPKGYKHRETNAKIFGIIEIEDFHTEGFKTEESEFKSCLRGKLSGIRYLKVNNEVLLPKGKATKFAEGFKEGYCAA